MDDQINCADNSDDDNDFSSLEELLNENNDNDDLLIKHVSIDFILNDNNNYTNETMDDYTLSSLENNIISQSKSKTSKMKEEIISDEKSLDCSIENKLDSLSEPEETSNLVFLPNKSDSKDSQILVNKDEEIVKNILEIEQEEIKEINFQSNNPDKVDVESEICHESTNQDKLLLNNIGEQDNINVVEETEGEVEEDNEIEGEEENDVKEKEKKVEMEEAEEKEEIQAKEEKKVETEEEEEGSENNECDIIKEKNVKIEEKVNNRLMEITEKNWLQYVLNYDDLIIAGLNNYEDVKSHWNKYGKLEGRIVPEHNELVFDWKAYIENNKDLLKIGINTYSKALNHWMNIGCKEGRKTHYTPDEELFDWEFYLHNNEDIKLKGVNLKEEAIEHWNLHGKKERRKHKYNIGENQYFDWVQYRENYPDLKKSLHTYEDALLHWHNHGQREGRTFEKLEEANKHDFDWREYVNSYEDLKFSGINSFEKAFQHWIYYGKKEGRVFKKLSKSNDEEEENVLTNFNNLYFKPKYSNYGLHYCGWEKIINNFIKNYQVNTFNGKLYEKIFFDEWLEKLLIWGNKSVNDKFISQIKKDNLKIISFIHNPNLRFNNSSIPDGILLTDEQQLNKNLISLLKTKDLLKHVEYLYCLSLSHKESLTTSYPELNNKIMSVHHPIIIDNKISFSYDKFLKNKKIIHIGWWLRNFNTFINLQVPPSFKKKIIIKNDFKKDFFSNIKLPSNNNTIEFKFQLNNNDYEELFTGSVVFADIVDGVANNTILECIAFNTPILLRRTPSSEEYLGPNYPLFFETTKDLMIMYEEPILLSLIQKSFVYLKEMNKTHINCETFNEKLNYDIMKLNKPNLKKTLTWNVYIIPEKITYLASFIEEYFNQINVEEILLNLFFNPNNKNNTFKSELKQQQQKTNSETSIKWIESKNEITIDEIKKYTETEYFCLIDISDTLETIFSKTHIEYLNNTPACDISTSSYYLINKNNDLLINKFKKNELFLNDVENSIGNENKLVFRTSILNLSFVVINSSQIINTDLLQNLVHMNLNINCCSEEPLHTINQNT